MPKPKWDFRDISLGLQMLREFLLGRKYTMHNRFPPQMAPRTIPAPDIPRGPDYKYSNQYYSLRSVEDSIKPPVVAPIAEGPSVKRDPKEKVHPGGLKPDSLVFAAAPTPGMPWGWDGHCYYDVKPSPPASQAKSWRPSRKPKSPYPGCK